jgi:cobalt-zinc-cadmium efflux system outer membrane protein
MSFDYRARTRTRRFTVLAPISAALSFMLAAGVAHAEPLTLEEVLSRTLSGSPAVQFNAAHLGASNASITEARARPRGAIGVDIEDFAGTGPYSGVDGSQTSAWYERTWERGGKRRARIQAAETGVEVTVQRNRLRLLDLMEQVQIAWVEAAAAEEAIAIAEQRLEAARRMEGEVSRRAARALDPLFAVERAKTAVAQDRIALDQAREGARIARANLAAFWGGSADISLEGAAFDELADTAATEDQNPDLALLNAEREAAQARVRLAETNDAADPTARIGVRHYGPGNEVALLVGGSLPLGSRAANQGNVERARAEQLVAETEIAVARIERMREFERLIAQRGLLADEVNRIQREVLPSAERAVELVQTGFARGGTAFTLMEVGQAQQAVAEARSRRIDLLRRFHLTGARIDRLTGRHISLLSSAEKR